MEKGKKFFNDNVIAILVFCSILTVIGFMITVSTDALGHETSFDMSRKVNNDFIGTNQIVNKQVRAVNKNDIHSYMETFHPDSPYKSEAYEMFRIFEQIDMEIDIEGITFVGYGENGDVYLQVKQSTYSMGKDGFYHSNDIVQVWKFRKYNETWYFFESKPITTDS